MRVDVLLHELRAGLSRIYQARLRGVYLFGSYARGEERPESDIDVLVVLDDIHGYAAEVNHTGVLIAELSVQYEVSINRVFVSEHDWEHGAGPFLEGVRREVVSA